MTLTCSRYGSPACGSWPSKGGTNVAARDGGGRGAAFVAQVLPRRWGGAAAGAGAEAGTALAPCCVRLEAAATTMTSCLDEGLGMLDVLCVVWMHCVSLCDNTSK